MSKGIAYALGKLRDMASEFCHEHSDDWIKLNNAYKEEHGFNRGNETLTLCSFMGSDLLIDFVYLARDAEAGLPFTNEYWLRSQGTQCIRTDADRFANKVFNDIVAKIKVVYDGNEFTDIHWFEDEDCLIKNRLIKND